MRGNSHLIERSELLAAILEKTETSYSDDISLLICYGSYVTGDHGSMSDIDFFFVPKTKKGYELNYQFILDQVGYDLWSVSWERLARISNLEEKLASILMDGELLFASSEEDLVRLAGLKNNLRQNLSDESVTRKISRRYMDSAKAAYFEAQDHAGDPVFIEALNIVETLLFAVAIINGTYTKKGVKKIEAELDRFSMQPAGFLETYRKLVRAAERAEVLQLVHELIVQTETLWKKKFESEEEPLDVSELANFYEEFKSTYNKLLLACDEQNYENAYYAAFLIDRETQAFLKNFTDPGTFADLIREVLHYDFAAVRAGCMEHERQLVELLHRNHIAIKAYRNIQDFRSCFLKAAA